MFQYVALLRRSPVSEPHWAELKQAGELSFKFTEASNAYDYVETIAEDWHFYPTQDILRADYLFSVFDAAAILRVLELLTPDNCALFLQMPDEVPAPVELSPHFRAPFHRSSLPADWLARWRGYAMGTHPLSEATLRRRALTKPVRASLRQPTRLPSMARTARATRTKTTRTRTKTKTTRTKTKTTRTKTKTRKTTKTRRIVATRTRPHVRLARG